MAHNFFEPLFYSLIPEPHDWEDAFIDNLIALVDRITWTGEAASLAGLIIWVPFYYNIISDKTRSIFLALSIALTVLFTAAAYFCSGVPALICITGASLCSASSISLLLIKLAGLLAPRRAGLFIAGGITLKYILVDLLIFPILNIWEPSFIFMASLLSICALLSGVLLLPVLRSGAAAAGNAPQPAITSAMPLPGKFTLLLISVILAGAVISAVMGDTIFYFYDAYANITNFWLYLHLFTFLAYLAAGFIFDKGLRIHTYLTALLCIGTCMAVTLFYRDYQEFGNVALSVIYESFKAFGSVMLKTAVLCAPLYYAAGKMSKIPPQAGFALLTLCSFAVPYALSGTREIADVMVIFNTQFSPVLGIALLILFGSLALVFALFRTLDSHERTVASAAVQSGISGSTNKGEGESIPQPGNNIRLQAAAAVTAQAGEIREKLIKAAIQPLTPRELEIAELTILGIKRKIIADTLFIQPSTVDTHRISIYGKFGVRTRDELLAAINKGSP